MKKIYCLLMVAGLVTACAKDDGAGDMPQGKGVVAFDATHQLTVETRADEIELGSLGITLPADADDLTLVIESQDPAHTEPFEYSGTVRAYNKDSRRTYLAEGGPYAAEVMWGNATTEGVDAAYFYGQTGFNVIARSHQNVPITAVMAKAMVRIDFTDSFKGYFENGAEMKLTTAAGATFDVNYTNGNVGKPFFVLAGEGKSFTITGKAKKQKPTANIAAPEVEFAAVGRDGSAGNEVAQQTIYTYMFDVDAADNVSVEITITNEPIQVIDVATKELNDDAVMGNN